MDFEEQLKSRQRRHEQLMKMIRDYHLSQEQLEYLDTIKKNTQIEIASRFVKSKHNKKYRFPLQETETDSENEDFPRGASFDHSTYDLKTQNYVKNQYRMKSSRDQITARRVKSLGQEKIDEEMSKNIRKELRQRPKQRGSRRQKLMFPELHRQAGSQKVLKTQQSVKYRQFSMKMLKNKNIQQARDQISKQKRQKKIGEAFGSKLLTEGGNLLSFGQAKVMINKLRVLSPKKGLKARY